MNISQYLADNGTLTYTNKGVSMWAICILGRGEANHIPGMLDRLKHSVSFYRLSCNMNPEAARVSWEAMRP
ncbi:MAG: hypothetical protein IJR63_03350 [Synergistaceae bacterium]|nr:hypothetical protein [Synergistaceae bacterium]